MKIAAITAIYILVLLTFSGNIAAQNPEPHFKDYPAIETYNGKNASIVLSRDDRMYRTRLREAAAQKPNFAGRYILVAWGCGAECLMGAAIDAKTGKVHWIPFTPCCWGGKLDDKEGFEAIDYRLDSKLIIFSGARNEKDGDAKKHFYKFEKNRFIEIP